MLEIERLRCGDVDGAGGEHLWFLENLDRIDRAARGRTGLEAMIRAVLAAVLDILESDRAWLLQPCAPAGTEIRVPMEETRPEYPGAFALGCGITLDPDVATVLQIVLGADGPVEFGPGRGHTVPHAIKAKFQVQSMIAMALHPRIGGTWVFGLHQCAFPRTWTSREARLFQEIGRRLEDGLSTFSMLQKLQESEERARLALDVANLGTWWHDLDEDIVHLDARTQELYGFDSPEANMEAILALAHPDDVERLARAVMKAHAPDGNGEYSVEHRIVFPDGTVRWIAKRSRTHFAGEGAARRAVKVVGTTHDITKRKHAEEVLRASEQRFRTFVDNAADAIFLHGNDQRVLDVNQQACDALGYAREELIGMSPLEFDTDLTAESLAALKARLATGEVITFDTHHRRKDGSSYPVEVRLRAFVEAGRFSAISMAHDISERKAAQEAVSLFRLLVDHANDAIEVLDPETLRFLDVNRTACELHGYTREEYLSMTVLDLDPWLAEQSAEFLSERMTNAQSGVLESQHRHKDGSLFPVEMTISLDQLDRAYIVAIVRDIRERKAAEQALHHSHNLLNAVVEGTGDTIHVKDMDGRYLMINAAGAQAFGRSREDIIGKRDSELFSPEVARVLLERDLLVHSTGESQVFEVSTDAGGPKTYLVTQSAYRDRNGEILGIIGISRDISELRRLEEQFRQAQKMEAVGRLAGGIAHDFNNLLTVICGNSELAFNRLQPGDPSRELIVQVQQASERATALTRQLLAFSRKQVLQPQVVSLNGVLRQLLTLLGRLLGEDIEITLGPDPSKCLAKVDPGQFEQAIINLAVNARDAMAAGGRLRFETQSIELDSGFTRSQPEVAPGRYVRVSVTDTGHGMNAETCERIFEPFFTTKGEGKGTGLGLAMVYGFVKQSGGHIEVESTPGNGTTFRLFLPGAERGVKAAGATFNSAKPPTGDETVLLVEDEEAVRRLSKKILQSNGYTVLEAWDGPEALSIAEGHKGPLHLLLTDVVMPRMSGLQLAEILSATRPAMKTLFISGYADTAIDSPELSDAAVAFLQKPFTSIALAQKVREVLDIEHHGK